MELGPIRGTQSTPFIDDSGTESNSLRSSVDSGYYRNQNCDVHIYDDSPLDPGDSSPGASSRLDCSSWYGGRGNIEDLKEHLQVSVLLLEFQIMLNLVRLGIHTDLDGCEQSILLEDILARLNVS